MTVTLIIAKITKINNFNIMSRLIMAIVKQKIISNLKYKVVRYGNTHTKPMSDA